MAVSRPVWHSGKKCIVSLESLLRSYVPFIYIYHPPNNPRVEIRAKVVFPTISNLFSTQT